MERINLTNHIALFEPLMPSNTGNIARTCAATDTVLHLIYPLGFRTDDKSLKRAGLDYWHDVNIVYHDDLKAFLATIPDDKYLYLITKFSDETYTDRDFSDTAVDHYFLFGKETTGLPEDFMRENPEKCLRIPMTDKVRALNLSNSAAIVIFEALRQQKFAGLEREHVYEHDKLK
jgi:tRNA (cytidine/uridine-2'-O-)-methyltransferase